MTRLASVASYDLKQLEVIAVYGLASYILFIIGFLGIYSYELHQAKQRSQQVSSVVNAVARSFVILVLFELFVAFVFILVTAVVPSGETPAVGIDAFWHIDWLDPNIMSTISITGSLKEEETAKTIVTLMAFTKITYLVALVMIFLITLSFAMSLPLEIMQRDQNTNGFAVGVQVFFSFIASALVYVVILKFTGQMLGWQIDFSDTLSKTSGLSNDIDLAEDLGYIIEIGMNHLNAMLPTLTPVQAN